MRSRLQFLPVLLIIFAVSIADLPFTAQGLAYGGANADTSSSLSAAVFSFEQTFPAPQGVHFERITTDDGLSNNYINRILQDSQGFMWFGTMDGLNKYDGHSFTVYRHEPENPHSLREDYIWSIYEDRAGVLWVGTLGGWLEKYDRQKDQFTHYKVSPDPSRVLVLHEDRAGVFWVQVDYYRSGADLLQFDRVKEEITLPLLQNTHPIFEDSSGVLWLGTMDGQLIFYDRENDRFEPLELSPDQITVHTSSLWLISIYEDHTGALWIGNWGDGLSRFERESVASAQGEVVGELTHFRNDPADPKSLVSDSVSTIVEDQSGVLWIGTWGYGLDRFDRESGHFTHYQNVPEDPHSLSDDFVGTLYVDRSGVLWVGTRTGINKLDLVGGNFQPYKNISDEPNSLGENDVSAIHQDHAGVIWIGTTNGLDRFDRQSGSWRHYRNDPDDPDSLSKNRIWSIYEDRSGVLWVGTPAGLDRYDSDSEKFIHHVIDSGISDVDIRSIYEDQTGKLWIASHAGLYQFGREANQFIPQRIGGANRKVSLFEDRSGVLWVGTAGDGLQRIDGDQYKTYQADPDEPESLSNKFVNAILEAESGTLWVGTGGGLDRFDRTTETFTHYTVADGLPDEEVLGILEDEAGYLWLSTSGGLVKFDPRTETFRNYDVSDGLQSDVFNQGATYKSSSGEMFFGGVNGFNAFMPEQITDNPHIPPVVVTVVNLFDQPVRSNPPDGDHIDLTYQENTLSFEFVTLDYAAPEKNQYATMLEGFDQEWDYIGTERTAEYRNLRPGDYIFRVKGSNSDGVWNEAGSAVHITIRPPIWQTWWFRGVIALALVGAAIGAYRLRVKGIEARSRELEELVEQRTVALKQEIDQRMQVEEALRKSEMEKAIVAERSRLARELHDSVTQSLYSVTLYADAAQRLLSAEQFDGVDENISKLGTAAKEALGEMRSLVYELLPPILEQEGLVAALEARLEAVEGRAGLETQFNVEGYGRLPSEVEAGLYGVAQEALNNALKHAHAGSISVTLRQAGQAVMLEIVDDGVGFDPHAEQAHGRLGLRGMEERVEQMGGRLEILSAAGEGTRVSVKMDLREDA